MLSSGDDDTVGLAALAASGVVGDFSHVLVDSERLSGDGRLIASNERVALSDGVLLIELLLINVVILLVLWVSVVELVLSLELHVQVEVLRVVVAADKTGVTGDGLTLFNNDDVTGNKLTSENGLLLVVTNDGGLHGDITLERSDDIGSLLLLVPTDDGVEQQDTADDTEIDPILKTSGEKSSELHDYDALVWR